MDDVYDWIFKDIKSKLDDPGVIYTLRERTGHYESIPSDIPAIDELLNGGLPEGRIVEIFGSEASGKTTLTLHFIAACQRRGYVTYFIDAEQALDLSYAKRVGVDPSKLLFSQPDHGEQALETARVICESTEAAQEKFKKRIRTLIVIDSVPALVPKEQYEKFEEKGFDESSTALGGPARMFAKFLPPLVNRAGKAGVTIVFINQERDNIGVMYGPKTTQPGGRALKFFSSLRISVRRSGFYEVEGENVGIRTKITPIKSKLFSIHGKSAEVIITANGIDKYPSIAEASIKNKVVKKSGGWYKIGEQSFQGQAQFENELRSNPTFCKMIEKRISESGGHAESIKLKVKEEKPEEKPEEKKEEKIVAPVETAPVVNNSDTPKPTVSIPAAQPPQRMPFQGLKKTV